jgi:hypothetical protein
MQLTVHMFQKRKEAFAAICEDFQDTFKRFMWSTGSPATPPLPAHLPLPSSCYAIAAVAVNRCRTRRRQRRRARRCRSGSLTKNFGEILIPHDQSVSLESLLG